MEIDASYLLESGGLKESNWIGYVVVFVMKGKIGTESLENCIEKLNEITLIALWMLLGVEESG